jgi:hypothetical protein
MNYVCDVCNYETPRLNNYNRHCESNKHKKKILSKQITFSNYCEQCNKSFQCSEKYHKQFKCKPIEKELTKKESTEKNQEVDIVSILCQFMEQQQSQNQKMMEMIVNKPTVVNNIVNHSVNNSVNNINNTVNVFLNEECKDAINWDDFIQNLQLPSSVDADITDIVRFSIQNQLKELGIYKRPIHCFKPKHLCIKNKDNWEEDSSKNHKLVIDSMDKMKNQMIKNWENKHPNWYSDESESEIAMNILSKLDKEVKANQCMNHIMKQTLVDLE